MNIQAISFCSHQIPYATKQEPPKIEVSNEELVNIAQEALKRASEVKNNRSKIYTESESIIKKSEQIQLKAQEIFAEIIDTSAYCLFCADSRRNSTSGAYLDQIGLEDGQYDIQITSEKITATKKGDTQDVYEFEFSNSEGKFFLTYCAKGKMKDSFDTFIDEEYYFGYDILKKYQAEVMSGKTNSIAKSFQYSLDRYDQFYLSSYASRIEKLLGKTKTHELYEFYSSDYGIKQYSKNMIETPPNKIQKEEEYNFDFHDNNRLKTCKFNAEETSKDIIKTYRQGFEPTGTSLKAKFIINYENESNYYVQANYNSDTCPEYSAICFYQNGEVMGSCV